MTRTAVLGFLFVSINLNVDIYADDWRFDAEVNYQITYFPEEGANSFSSGKTFWNWSIMPEWSWRDEQDQVVFTPFFRLDSDDQKNSYFEPLEAYWLRKGTNWSSRVGVSRVSWGVMESLQLVDIINQTDLIAGVDGQTKLGQSMLNINWLTSWGEASFYVLPQFNERRFGGPRSRPSLPVLIADTALYESSSQDAHIDYAMRVGVSSGLAEWGVSFFNGTSRDPLFLLPQSSLEWTPYYPQISQVGLDFLYPVDEILLKFESTYRRGFSINPDSDNSDFSYTAGLEFFQYGILNSSTDITWIFERQRNNQIEFIFNPLGQKDIDISSLAARFVLNNIDDTRHLLGVVKADQESGFYFYLESSTRIARSTLLNIEVRVINNLPNNNEILFSILEQESHISVSLTHYL